MIIFQKKRVGRGPASGYGKTSRRGKEGQRARSGPGIPVLFEGGQLQLYKKLPKYGFTNRRFQRIYDVVSLAQIQYMIDTGRIINDGTITMKTLQDCGLVKKLKYPGVKIVADVCIFFI